MRPDGLDPHYYFGGGSADTHITALALCITVLASLLILALPRRFAIVPFFFAALLVYVSQDVVIAGLHFQVFRILILVGWIRMVAGGYLTGGGRFPERLNSLDKVLLLWACCNAVTYTILWGASGALVFKLGFLYTTLGSYFLLRYMIRDRDDVLRAIKTLAVVCAIIAVFMVVEHSTGRNAFSIFGARELSEIRYGKVRAQGPFQHSIIAGMFGAMLLPLYIGLWWQGTGHRLAAGLGVIASTAMMISSSSSTPLMTFLAGIGGLCFWWFRRRMRLVRWALVSGLVGLQIAMKAPIWFLFAKLALITGGTGWDRSELIDTFVRHFSEWWLIGTQNNASWGYDMWDCINGYVSAGTEGGLITFILFISVLVCGYKIIGRSRALAADDRKSELLIWGIGACLFANTVGFLGETYYDQSVIGWYAVLVMISAASALATDAQPAQPEPDAAGSPFEAVLAGNNTAWNNF